MDEKEKEDFLDLDLSKLKEKIGHGSTAIIYNDKVFICAFPWDMSHPV